MDGCHLVLVIYYYSFYCIFFFLYKTSTCTWIWNYFPYLLTEKGKWCRALLGSSTESTDAKILFKFSDLSQTFHFHLTHQLAQWMFWQISSLWWDRKNWSVSFYDFSTKTSPVTLHLAETIIMLSWYCLSMILGHPQAFLGGFLLTSVKVFEQRFVPCKCLNVVLL